jgi:hypothetical protein
MSTPALAAFPPEINLSDLDGSNGFVLNGVNVDDWSGFSVSGLGDVNGDDIDDLIIGGPNREDLSGFPSGKSYVVFGGADIDDAGVIELSELDGTNGFTLDTFNPSDSAGSTVSDAGDVNGDGIDDLIIGAPGIEYLQPTNRSYVVFGVAGLGGGGLLDLSGLDGTNGFAINGIADFDQSGKSVAGVGDVNDDGYEDLATCAPRTDPNGVYSGQCYVVFGDSGIGSGGVVELSALNGTNGFAVNGIAAGDQIGRPSGVGDVNDDGIDDFIIGASAVDTFSGQSYVIFGQTDLGSGGTLELSALDGDNGFVLNGINDFDGAGTVSGAGDVNDDGVADLLIGANGASPNGDLSGQSYVVFGDSGIGSGGVVELSALNGTNGFAINGIAAGDRSGNSVANAGDVNGDSIDDIIVGAWWADTNVSSAGQSYVVFGDSGIGSGGVVELSALNGTNGFAINGINLNDQSGVSVSGASDINDDGVHDVIIGARFADPNGDSSGQSYVVFGQKAEAFDRPMVQCPGDINTDGIADIVVVTPDGNTWIKGLDGVLVSQFSLTEVNTVVDVETMPNINANGSPELVALGTGSVKAEVRDTLTGEQLSVVDFDPALEPLDLELIDDQTSNGVPELANLAQGSVKVQVKDGLTAQSINTVEFNTYVDPIDLEIYPDLNGNGAPELAVLGDNADLAKSDKIEIRDLDTGNKLHDIWLGKGWQVLQQELITDRNGNGSPEAAVLRIKQSNNAVNVLFRDTKTRQSFGSIGFDRNYPPIKLLTLADINGNGADEVVVFGQRFNGANQKAQIKDSKTRALIRLVFFDKNAPGQDIATCADINGNGSEELVMLGKRASDGKLRAIVKDAKTGERIGVVNF